MNPAQERVVALRNNHTLLNSPPGAGKTYTMTMRVVELIKEGKVPRSILFLTHTNEATDNTKKRLKEHLPPAVVSEITVQTIHSFAQEIMNHIFPYSSGKWEKATNVDMKDCMTNPSMEFKIFKQIDKMTSDDPVSEYSRLCAARIEAIREDPSSYSKRKPGELLKKFEEQIDKINHTAELAKNGYEQYRRKMVARRLYVYEHVITSTIDAINTVPALQNNIWSRYKHMLVDECQDISDAQRRLLKSIKGPDTIVMFAGDEHQSIYGFGGAAADPYKEIQNDFKLSFEQVELTENYRSTPYITNISRFIVTHQPFDLETTRGTIGVVTRYNGKAKEDPEYEIVSVGLEIASLINSGVSPDSIAVLSRNHKPQDLLSRVFQYLQVPFHRCRKEDISQFRITRHILLLLKYIGVEEDPTLVMSDISDGLLLRILHADTLLGDMTPSPDEVRRFFRDHYHFTRKGNMISFREWLGKHAVGTKTLRAVESIMECVYSCVGEGPLKTLQRIYIKFMPSSYWNVVKPLVDHAKMEERKHEGMRVAEYADLLDRTFRDGSDRIEEAALYTAENAVKLMTCHASKSLGFKYVFITGADSDTWKVSNDYFEQITMPKERAEKDMRMLFHVSISRAKENLHISYQGEPCLYVQELIDDGYILHQDGVTMNADEVFRIMCAIGVNDPRDMVEKVEMTHCFPVMSATLLMSIERCAFATHLEKVLSVNMTNRKDSSCSAMVTGEHIHQIFEAFHKERNSTGMFPDSAEDFVRRHPTASSLTETKLTEVVSYIDSRQPRWREEYDTSMCVMAELTLQGELKSPAMDTIQLKGKLDRVSQLSPTKYKIFNYKTGKKSPDKLRKDYRTQAIFYVMLSHMNGFVDTNEVVFDFLNDGEVTLTVKKSEVEEMKNRIIAAMTKIRGTELEKCGKTECSWCGYKLGGTPP